MNARWSILACIAVLALTGCNSDNGGNEGDADPVEECDGPEDCSDGIDCTVESCYEGQCRHSEEDEECDDGNRCNGEEICDSTSGCVDGEPMVCDDMIACTTDWCDDDTQRCMTEADDDNCDADYHCDPSQGGCVPD